MYRLLRRCAFGATLSLAALFGATAPAHAQGATPIANGHVTVAGVMGGATATTFSVVELPNGAIVGHGISSNSLGGWVRFDITSFVMAGDTLLMAGPVTATFNAPPNFIVGGTFILGVQDHGNGSGDPAPDRLANGFVPFPVTATQVLVLIGPPPQEALRPALLGNLTIH